MAFLDISTLYTTTVSQATVDHCNQNLIYRKRVIELEAKIDQLQTLRNKCNRIHPQERMDTNARISNLEIQVRGGDEELRKLGNALAAGPVFRIRDKVELIGGKWYWELPEQ